MNSRVCVGDTPRLMVAKGLMQSDGDDVAGGDKQACQGGIE
jgi:hypothetical protein